MKTDDKYKLYISIERERAEKVSLFDVTDEVRVAKYEIPFDELITTLEQVLFELKGKDANNLV